MAGQLTRARQLGAGLQVAHVSVRGGYTPNVVEARAGMPLRLVFHREEDTPCSDRVVFSSPHVDRHLAPYGDTTIELPAQGPGEVRFTCAMGRYRGLIRLTGSLPAGPEQRRDRSVAAARRISGALIGLFAAAAVISILASITGHPLWHAAAVTVTLLLLLAAGVALVTGRSDAPSRSR